MHKHQEKIFKDKRTFLYYHKAQEKTKYLIPNTKKAKKKAVSNGAQYFDTFSFCRSEKHSLVPVRMWGDLYIKFINRQYLMKNEDLKNIKKIITTYFDNRGVLSSNKKDIKIMVLGKEGFGISIPARLFQIENGYHLLPEIYQSVTEQFKKYCLRYDPKNAYSINQSNLKEIENTKCKDHYNVQLSLDDFLSKNCEELQVLSSTTQKCPELTSCPEKDLTLYGPLDILRKDALKIRIKKDIKYIRINCGCLNKIYSYQSISKENAHLFASVIERFPNSVRGNLIAELKKKVLFEKDINNRNYHLNVTCNDLKIKGLCTSPHCNRNHPFEIFKRWPQTSPLDGAKKLPQDLQTIKCAISIIQKMARREIIEFQARDAHRRVRGSFPTINEVECGLQLLVKHKFLIRCDLPEYSYPGRRPSPWFLVNPNGKDKLLTQ